MDSSILSALTRPGNLSFPSNLSLAGDFSSSGGRMLRRPGGHLIFYGPRDHRILATDPDGNPLHECEWVSTPTGTFSLARARFRLDWGQWIGLKPAGLMNMTTLDLSRKTGWERLRPDDLRQMAAQALQVALEEMRCFYGDEDLHIDTRGRATIRHKKDAFYVLDDGTFDVPPDRVRFMACMGAMHWDHIDFLPVVELFQSLLPGTGSAAFELIRGLYDDQNERRPQPLPLRYRGIPTYPSEAAFRLFSGFFLPSAPAGQKAFDVFIDPSRSHEVTWLPAPDPPRRYFDSTRNLCVTIKDEIVQKATLADDPTGLSFVKAGQGHVTPYQRSVGAAQDTLVLMDEENRTEMPIPKIWGAVRNSMLKQEADKQSGSPSPPGWRALFGGAPPSVAPMQAFSTVLLYPDDDKEIGEMSTQPFAVDYVQDLMEDVPALASHWARVNEVLIHNFDATLTTCINLTQPSRYTVLYHHPPYAQRQAQTLWMLLAGRRRLDWVTKFRFLPGDDYQQQAYQKTYDLIHRWVPFDQFREDTKLSEVSVAIANALKSGGLAFVAGPSKMGAMLQGHRLRILHADPMEQLPTFQMHRTVLPKARLKPDLMLFQLSKEQGPRI